MSSDDKHIIDTVVLLYFLLVGEEDLLCTLLGTPLQVPLAVYDPEDRDLPPTAHRRTELLSEMRQAVGHYESSVRPTDDADPGSRGRAREPRGGQPTPRRNALPRILGHRTALRIRRTASDRN